MEVWGVGFVRGKKGKEILEILGVHQTKQDEVKRVSHQALKPQKPRYNCQCKK